jgi:hypothetical protein
MWWRVLSIGLMVALWELFAALHLIDSMILPPPHLFIAEIQQQAQFLLPQVGVRRIGANFVALTAIVASLQRVVLGLALAFVTALVMGSLAFYITIIGKLTLPTVGMQQRAAIARALCLGADVLLMDEPFAALDVQTRFQMQSFLLDIWQGSGKTVVFVTHHIDEAVYLADRVIILTARPGRLLDSVAIDMPRPRNVISEDFERYRALFVERLRLEVTKAFQEQELAEMLDTRIK